MVESLKIITRQASLRVAEYAFHYAKTHGRERVSAIHKANIMQKTDGLFLKVWLMEMLKLQKIIIVYPYGTTVSLIHFCSVVARLQRSILR